MVGVLSIIGRCLMHPRVLIGVVITCILVQIAYLYGTSCYEHGKLAGIESTQDKLDKANNIIAKMKNDAIVQANKHAEQMAKASKDYQELKAKKEHNEKVQYIEVQKIVEKPIYRNICIDDNGLSELNRAIKNE